MRSNSLLPFLESKLVKFQMQLKRKKDDTDEPNLEEKCAVVCTDVSQLIHLLIQHCHMDPTNCDVAVGIDGGQGMLKVGATDVCT